MENGNKGTAGLISRRKLLASIGMAGAAIAANGLLGGAGMRASAESGGEAAANALTGTSAPTATDGLTGTGALTGTDAPAGKSAPTATSALTGTDCVEPATIAELRANTLADSEVYLIVDPGHTGHFVYDASDSSSADNTGTVLVTASGKRYKRLAEAAFVNVRWFGAKGDGTTDDSAAIQAANDYAAAVHGVLLFPYGVYRGSGFTPTVSWLSYENAVIRSNAVVPASAFHGDFVRVESQSRLVFEGLTFDGNVSADPASWSSANYNAFSGSVGLFLLNSSQIRLGNCIFQNSFFSTLRLTGCQEIDIESCTMRKARGNFGDAVYVEQSYNVNYDRCQAEDYTRIGFVTENGTAQVTYSQCYAKNGHNASILYGGGESNSGFWSERSENISFSQCTAENNTHRGFTCVTLFSPSNTKRTEVAAFALDSCLSIDNTSYGFVFNGANHHVISVSCTGCYAYGSYMGYHLTATDHKDAFRFTNCYVHLSFADTTKAYTGFLVNIVPVGSDTASCVNLIDCGTVLGDGDRSSLSQSGSLSADMIVYSGAKAVITVDRYTNAGAPGHMVLKSWDGSPTIGISNCEITVPVIKNFTALRFDSCRFGTMTHVMGIAGSQGPVSLNHCTVKGPMKIVTNGRVNVRDSLIALTGADALRVVQGASSNDMLTEFHGCRFEKDVSTGNYAVHLYENGASKPKAAFHGCTFYQTSTAATTTMPFIWLEFAGTTALFVGCYADNNVSFPVRTVTSLSAPAGITLIGLH